MSYRAPSARAFVFTTLFIGQLGFATWVWERKALGSLGGKMLCVAAGAIVCIALCLRIRTNSTVPRLLLGAIAGHLGGVSTYLLLAFEDGRSPFVLGPFAFLASTFAAPFVTWSWLGGALLAASQSPMADSARPKAEAAQQDDED